MIWQYVLMGSELGTETAIGLIMESSAKSSIIFRDRGRQFYYGFRVEKLLTLYNYVS